MAVVSAESAKSFLAGVKLPTPRARKRGEEGSELFVSDGDAQALVVGSGLIVAGEGVPKLIREDIVNCTLLAQLIANVMVAARKDVVGWYDKYFEALAMMGFAVHDQRFERYETKSEEVAAHESILMVLTTLLGPGAGAVAVVTRAIEALKSIDNQPWITLFDRESAVVESARFQVATAQVDETGMIEIALLAFHLQANAKVEQVLFFKSKKKSTKLDYASGRATIYEAAMKGQRQLIAEKLKAHRTSYIGSVELPPPPSVRSSRGKRGAKRKTNR